MNIKKSIVLCDTKNNTERKAVLSLQEELGSVKGSLRLYNFPAELEGISSLGFYFDQKVIKAGLTQKAYMLYEFFLDLKQIPQNFSVAVVNFQNAVATPILYGSSQGSDDNIYGSIISTLSGQKLTAAGTAKVLDNFGVQLEEESMAQVEKDIDDALCKGNCEECVYKKYFYENQPLAQEAVAVAAERQDFSEPLQTFESAPQKIAATLQEEKEEQPQQAEKEPMFFDKLKPQIDKLFEKNPVESNLQSLIPSSKWVKVEYEDDGDFYVFGLLYDEQENVKYVCYGIPAVFDQQPPKELSGFPIWLPLNQQDGFGYWLTYQDASTGEPVKAIME